LIQSVSAEKSIELEFDVHAGKPNITTVASQTIAGPLSAPVKHLETSLQRSWWRASPIR
jgi:hypothetical protein